MKIELIENGDKLIVKTTKTYLYGLIKIVNLYRGVPFKLGEISMVRYYKWINLRNYKYVGYDLAGILDNFVIIYKQNENNKSQN